jgi:Fur family ferric uptake transcriptional regulator
MNQSTEIAHATSRIEVRCVDKGMKMTEQRRVIARVLSAASDHPDVEEVHRRSIETDPRISIATVYRTVRLFEESDIIKRHDFGDGRARYEPTPDNHHDHLIDVHSGKVIEFQNDDIERLQQEVARSYGYKLVSHRLELFVEPLDADAKAATKQ